MDKKIVLITGGQRSGKSSHAERMALSLSDNPVYMATSRVWDDEHRQRIEQHKARRGKEWENIEEDKQLSIHKLENRVILIDCVTLWATNFFFDSDANVQSSLLDLQREFDDFTKQDATFIFVSNEIGMGEMSPNANQRKFADLQGWFNQYIATKADEVFLMVSGIPMQVKPNTFLN